MSFINRCKFAFKPLAASPILTRSTLSSFPRSTSSFSTLLNRSYTSFSRPINKISTFSHHQQLLTIKARNLREEGYRRFYNDFGQIPNEREENPSYAYLFLAGGALVAYVFYIHEPAYAVIKIDAASLPSDAKIEPINSDLLLVHPVASLWRRIFASFLDSLLIYSVFTEAFIVLAGQYGLGLVIAASVSYEVFSCVYTNGKTLGKYLMGIQVVRDDGLPISYTTALKYSVSKVLNLFFMSDVLYALFNISGYSKCIHNVFSRTYVGRVSNPVKTESPSAHVVVVSR